MKDIIYRQNVLEVIQNMYPGMPRVPWMRRDWQKRYKPYIRIEEAIKSLPSAQPKQRWIPCRKRFPDKSNFYLCTKKNGLVKTVWYEGAFEENVIAWMPLPEPYKGEQ